MKKASVHSVIKGEPIIMPDNLAQNADASLLKSVYEKRINQGAIVQTRPGS